MQIYMITCSKDGKKYVGSTSRECGWEVRWNEHVRGLRGNRHANPILQAAWNAHGAEGFICQLLEELAEDDVNVLIKREQQLIEQHACMAPAGFNLKEAGNNGKPGEMTRQKMSQSKMGEKNSYFGRKHSPEIRARISEKIKGKKYSDERNAALSRAMSGEGNPFYGRKHTADTLEKIGRVNRGKCMKEEQKLKLSKALKGRPKSEETKRKMSEAARRRGELSNGNH